MGSGNSGLYGGAYTGSVPGSAYYMKSSDNFSRFIKLRKDKDVNGFYDVIAHGSREPAWLNIVVCCNFPFKKGRIGCRNGQ